MAFAIPGNGFIDALMNDRKNPASLKALQAIVDNGDRLDAEDYRTVNTDRGPVRGMPGGRAGNRL